METLLQKQLDTYARQVKNGQMSPSTYNGYAKAISGERMRRWHGLQVGEVLPGLLREMDCTSKAIRNILTPLRGLFEDALNDELIDFNPFERIALSKLIRQTAKASDYVVMRSMRQSARPSSKHAALTSGPCSSSGLRQACAQASCKRCSGAISTGTEPLPELNSIKSQG